MIKLWLLKTAFLVPDPALLMAICYTESEFKNRVHRQDGNSSSYGICQLKLQTARQFIPNLKSQDLMLPFLNLQLASFYLAQQLRRYHGNIRKAISAYNAGSFRHSNVQYVNKVMRQRRIFQESLKKEVNVNI